jgi:RND family efflux transporter MFP subunit
MFRQALPKKNKQIHSQEQSCLSRKQAGTRFAFYFLPLILFSSFIQAQTTVPVSAANRIALGIETEAVLLMDSFAQVTATGVVIAPQGSAYPVTSPFDGVLVRPLVFPGMSVEAGQSIALLHSPDYSTAKAEQETMRLTLVHNEHLYESAENLHQLGLRSELELDEARHELDSARLELTAMADRLALVSQGEKAGQFVLAAPVDGVVNNFALDPGDEVVASMTLATIFEGSEYWARIQVPETGASQVELQARVEFSETGSTGMVVSIAPQIDPDTRSLEVIVELPADVQWRIGQLVSASFLSSVKPGTQALPEQAIVRIGGDTFVFVEIPTGFRLTPVTIVSRARDVVIVAGELEAEDQVAVSGLAALKNIIEGA